jgi:hypothetical protein
MGISFTYAPLGGKCPNFTSFKSSNGSGLNSALVTDLIDKQSIAYAVKTFSENVESALRKNDADKEATRILVVG